MILAEDLLKKLKTKMENRITTEFSDAFLISELQDAIFKVAERRWVDINRLDKKYESAVVEIALYNLSLIGADFQVTHNENGINRMFRTEEEILKKVTPKARASKIWR